MGRSRAIEQSHDRKGFVSELRDYIRITIQIVRGSKANSLVDKFQIIQFIIIMHTT